jgi:hypothetical protein
MMDEKDKTALGVVALFIFKRRYETNWDLAVDIAGLDRSLDNHPRLVRSQYWEDEDYPKRIYNFLYDVFDTNPEACRKLLAFVVGRRIPSDEGLRYSLARLGVVSSVGQSKLPVPEADFRLIDANVFPDDFYAEIVNLTNRCYALEMNTVVPLLIRKLFENLLIDIIRAFYGTQSLDLFYDKAHGKFNDFSILLDNMKTHLPDFQAYHDVLGREVIAVLNKWREVGNSTAHSIATRIDKKLLHDAHEELSQTSKALFKAYSLIIRPK